MFKELFIEAYKIKDRASLVPANEILIYEKGEPKYKYKYYNSGWKVSEFYSQSSVEPKEWTKYKKSTYSGDWNAAEIIDNELKMGASITNVEVLK